MFCDTKHIPLRFSLPSARPPIQKTGATRSTSPIPFAYTLISAKPAADSQIGDDVRPLLSANSQNLKETTCRRRASAADFDGERAAQKSIPSRRAHQARSRHRGLGRDRPAGSRNVKWPLAAAISIAWLPTSSMVWRASRLSRLATPAVRLSAMVESGLVICATVNAQNNPASAKGRKRRMCFRSICIRENAPVTSR